MQKSMVRGQRGQLDYDVLPNSAMRVRRGLGRTLLSVANEIDVSMQSLHEFEKTGRGLGRDNQWRLAFALGVEYHELLKPGKKFAEKVRQHLDK